MIQGKGWRRSFACSGNTKTKNCNRKNKQNMNAGHKLSWPLEHRHSNSQWQNHVTISPSHHSQRKHQAVHFNWRTLQMFGVAASSSSSGESLRQRVWTDWGRQAAWSDLYMIRAKNTILWASMEVFHWNIQYLTKNSMNTCSWEKSSLFTFF